MEKRNKNVVRLFVAAVLFAIAGSAAAQTYLNEVSIFGTWDNIDEPADQETIALHLRYGRFVTERLVGIGTISRQSFDGPGPNSKTTALLVGAKYYFTELRPPAIVPFGEASIGFANTDAGSVDDTDFSWEFGVGAALMISERTSIDGSFRFFATETDARTEGTRFFLGLTTRF
ncbi:MAG TPA: outer membrane beta-barrel protein [Burkholderiales bacterium]|nr:outer membrane beta-barrel protein [Burkholderiales bacterium]